VNINKFQTKHLKTLARNTSVFVMLFDKSKHCNQLKMLIMTVAIWYWVSICLGLMHHARHRPYILLITFFHSTFIDFPLMLRLTFLNVYFFVLFTSVYLYSLHASIKLRRKLFWNCAAVVRQPRHNQLVEWYLAQRRFRQLPRISRRWSCSPGLADGRLSLISHFW